jgi:hypothetical protein
MDVHKRAGIQMRCGKEMERYSINKIKARESKKELF